MSLDTCSQCVYCSPMTKGYSLKDITRILGLKRSALQQWIDRGFIAPSIQRADGQKARNIWSRGDILDMAIFRKLLKHGFTREYAARIIQEKTAWIVDEDGPREIARETYEVGAETFIVYIRMEHVGHTGVKPTKTWYDIAFTLNAEYEASLEAFIDIKNVVEKIFLDSKIASISSVKVVNITGTIQKVTDKL